MGIGRYGGMGHLGHEYEHSKSCKTESHQDWIKSTNSNQSEEGLRNMTKIWTDKARVKMYHELKTQFGPHLTWPTKTRPVNKVGYEQFLESKCKEVGCKSPDAVEQQIKFAITDQSKNLNKGHERLYSQNKVAALITGFLDYNDVRIDFVKKSTRPDNFVHKNIRHKFNELIEKTLPQDPSNMSEIIHKITEYTAPNGNTFLVLSDLQFLERLIHKHNIDKDKIAFIANTDLEKLAAEKLYQVESIILPNTIGEEK